jgi:hypothetical protein
MHVIWQWVFSGTGGRALQLEERVGSDRRVSMAGVSRLCQPSIFCNLILIQSGILSDESKKSGPTVQIFR